MPLSRALFMYDLGLCKESNIYSKGHTCNPPSELPRVSYVACTSNSTNI